MALASLTLAVLVVQLAYPSSRALPFTQIGSQSLALGGTESIEAALQALQKQPFVVNASQKSYTLSWIDAGIEIDIPASMQKVTEYPLSQRLVPFSMFYHSSEKSADEQILTHINETKLSALAQKIAEENSKAPAEGSINVQGTTVAIKDPEPGAEYKVSDVAATLRGLTPGVSKVDLRRETTYAVYSKAALELAADKARKIIAQPLNITTLDKTSTFQPATIASWFVFVPDPTSKEVNVEFNRGLIKAALQEHAAEVHLAPGWTTAATNEGVRSSRTPGSPGHMLALDATVEAVVVALTGSLDQTKGITAAIPPSVGHDYSATSVGLQHLLDDWVANNSSASWGIVVRELGGQQRYAAIRQHDEFLTASVYKLYLAYAVLTKVDDGSLDPNAVTSTGYTVNTCIEYMIVRSDNACSHALGDMTGWDTVTAMQHAKGFTSTTINMSSGFYTTANDTTEILERLHAGNLMTSGPNARLLDMMKRQVYRNGIPVGSTPSIVANKVGYVDGWRHDVGIVYHPKGVYIISVLSYGGSYPQVVNLSRSIYNYMSR